MPPVFDRITLSPPFRDVAHAQAFLKELRHWDVVGLIGTDAAPGMARVALVGRTYADASGGRAMCSLADEVASRFAPDVLFDLTPRLRAMAAFLCDSEQGSARLGADDGKGR